MKQIQFAHDDAPSTLILMTEEEFSEFCDLFEKVSSQNKITNGNGVVGVGDINRLRGTRFLAYMRRDISTAELFDYLKVETDIMTISVAKHTMKSAGDFVRKLISTTN
jgi:hypothetical protein